MGEEFNYTFSYGQVSDGVYKTTTNTNKGSALVLQEDSITIRIDPISNKVKAHILGIHPKKVIYRDKYTIVIWEDNTKTIVKCSNLDEFDKEKGFLMALTTKVYGKPVMNYLRKEFCEKVEKDG